MLDQGITLNNYLWDYVDGETVQNNWINSEQVPANNATSDAMAKDLKKRGFTFDNPNAVKSCGCGSSFQA